YIAADREGLTTGGCDTVFPWLPGETHTSTVLHSDPPGPRLHLWGPHFSRFDGRNTTAKSAAEVGTDWKVAGTGDFNGDGTTDMVLNHTNAKGNLELEGYLISNNHITSANLLGEVGAEWKFAGVGDFNGDGT